MKVIFIPVPPAPVLLEGNLNWWALYIVGVQVAKVFVIIKLVQREYSLKKNSAAGLRGNCLLVSEDETRSC